MSCPLLGLSRLRYTKQEPEVLTEALIDTSQFLGSLKYSVWKKMADIVYHCEEKHKYCNVRGWRVLLWCREHPY